ISDLKILILVKLYLNNGLILAEYYKENAGFINQAFFNDKLI
ncbi:MAG: hypothetical protein RLZZ102_702, partial [Pseudomonadota bacterium]